MQKITWQAAQSLAVQVYNNISHLFIGVLSWYYHTSKLWYRSNRTQQLLLPGYSTDWAHTISRLSTTILSSSLAWRWVGTLPSDQETCQPAQTTWDSITMLFMRNLIVLVRIVRNKKIYKIKNSWEAEVTNQITWDQYEIHMLRISWVIRGSDKPSTMRHKNRSCLLKKQVIYLAKEKKRWC